MAQLKVLGFGGAEESFQLSMRRNQIQFRMRCSQFWARYSSATSIMCLSRPDANLETRCRVFMSRKADRSSSVI